MAEQRLEGGYVDGAVRVGDTVRRQVGPWTPAVHALLAYLADQGFTGAPRPLGFDERGREVLTFLEGETIGRRKPRPAWVHAEDTLIQVARWLREFHQTVAGFVPPSGAIWRAGGTWSPGQIVAHNDVTTHNAAWHRGTLTGFFDWDFAGPATAEWDVALAGFAWVPLHLRSVVAAEGFTDFAARPRRLDLFLTTYGWSGTTADFLAVVEARMNAHAAGIRARAAAGEVAFGRLLRQGVPDAVDRALADPGQLPPVRPSYVFDVEPRRASVAHVIFECGSSRLVHPRARPPGVSADPGGDRLTSGPSVGPVLHRPRVHEHRSSRL